MTKDEFRSKYNSGELSYRSTTPEVKNVNSNDIITSENWNTDNEDFWNHHGRSKEEYLDYVDSGEIENQKPIDVYSCDDKYVLVDDGNHRVAAAQELDADIKVNVTGEYVDKSQENSNDSLSTTKDNDKVSKISSQLKAFREERGEPGTTSPALNEHNVTPENERESMREKLQDMQNERENNLEQEND
jgi:hypothetical protein